MRKVHIALFAVCAACSAGAEVTFDYTGQGAVFDGTNRVEVLLNDGGVSLTMTVEGGGGDLNSNAGGFGIGNDLIEGTGESLTISFDRAVDFVSIDLSGVGSTAEAGARLTIGSLPAIDLFTGVEGFSGSADIYTPASPVRLNAGDTIVLTGSSATSSFDLDQMTFTAVPEPSTMALSGLGMALAWLIRKRSRG